MSEQYSHRNGETEPPTINGWFGYDGPRNNAVFGGELIKEGVSSKAFVLVDGDEFYRYVWEGDTDQTIVDYPGRWWGPVTLPWETEGRA